MAGLTSKREWRGTLRVGAEPWAKRITLPA
jgi:hypothetical protein